MDFPRLSTIAARILIPWDGLTPINQVLSFARTLGGHDTRLVVLPVMSDAPRESAFAEGSVEVLRRLDVMTDPTSAIAEVAAQRAVDLILMATPCQTSRELDPTCLAARIALDSPIPVMVVHFACDNLAAFPPSISRVLVPVDGSARAAQALPVAGTLACRLGAPVQLVMVIDPNQALPPAYAHDPEATATMVASLTHDAHWALGQAERMLRSYQVEVCSDFLYGPVVSSLEAAVAPGDMIVITTHGIGNAPRGRLGSVAARLLADVPGPLVILRGTPPSEVVSADIQHGRYESIPQPTA